MSDEVVELAQRSAQRLAVRAACGLALLSLAGVAALGGGLAALGFAWATLSAEGWLLALPWAGIGAFALLIGWSFVASVFAPGPAPIGVALSRDLAPSLHEFVDEIGDAFGGLQVDTLWITGDINAAVLRRPRWGLVGPMETHLLIGLPLAHSVSERQLGAIVAHEYGHLIQHAGPAAAWRAHLRGWWFRAIERCIDRMPRLAWLLDRLTRAEVELAMYLAREEEFAADRAAADAMGARLVAATLVEVAARERFLRCDFWVKVMEQCARSPRPTMRPFRDMGLGMVAGFLPGQGRVDCLLSSFAADDAEDELHPSLAERLEALGEEPELDTLVEDSFAERHLGLLLSRLAWELDRAWWADHRSDWRSTYRRSREGSESA